MKVAQRWFTRIAHAHGITQLHEPHVHRIIRCNVWHVRGRDRDLVVDTGLGLASVRRELADLLDRHVLCLATHRHYDHVGGLFEFDERLMHPDAAARMDPNRAQMPLRWSQFEPDAVDAARRAGYEIATDEMLTALPSPAFDIDAFHMQGALATGEVDQGDVIDLGDRRFEVLDLPGHTPCSIGLWEEGTGTLFAGDAVYDGPLVDFLPESDAATYVRTLERLRALPVEVVHAGHDPSFGRDQLTRLIDGYLGGRS